MPFPDFTPTVPELLHAAAARFGARTYLVAGTREPSYLNNAARRADALRNAGADVVMNE